MEEFIQLVAAFLRLAVAPLTGYAVIRLARRWPLPTLAVLLALLAAGVGALGYARHDGFSVSPETRRMEFASEAGRWCYVFGAVVVVLGVPALPLVAVARTRNGEQVGPVGGQWFVALFGYFMACAVWGAVLYSWLTGIVK